MKRIACLLSCTLILLWAFHGVTAAQQLPGRIGPLHGNSDPLDKVKNPKAKEKVDKPKEKVDKPKEKVDKPKEKVDNVLPSVEQPVDDVSNEVEKSADEVDKDGSEVAKDSGGTAGARTPSKPDIAALGSSAATKLASSTDQSGTGSKDALGAEPSDTDKVVAAGNAIESAQVKGESLAAPETDVNESEGSGLALTGAHVLAWLVLACLLMAIGATLVWRGRTG